MSANDIPEYITITDENSEFYNCSGYIKRQIENPEKFLCVIFLRQNPYEKIFTKSQFMTVKNKSKF